MRRGFSLSELVLVVALIGILLAIGVPRLASVLDGIEVQAAANRVVAVHWRARMLAVIRSQVLVLSVNQDALTIRHPGGVVPLWTEAGPAQSGISLDGPPRQFTFSPEGVTLGLSNATLRLTRGSATRAVVISRLGRVRITP